MGINGTESEAVTLVSENYYYRKVGDHATNMPASMYYGDRNTGAYGMTENVRYAYDGMGNITKVYENGKMKIRYEYDALNRLVREDNKGLKRTEVYWKMVKKNVPKNRSENQITCVV